jgi:hypothetical protein
MSCSSLLEQTVPWLTSAARALDVAVQFPQPPIPFVSYLTFTNTHYSHDDEDNEGSYQRWRCFGVYDESSCRRDHICWCELR